MADSAADVRKRLADKREKLADARMAKGVAEADGAEALEVAHLLAEEARVDAQLQAAQDAAKPANVKAGYASNLDAATAAMQNYGGKVDPKLPKDGSTLEKPMGVNPDGSLIEPDDELPNADKAGAKGGVK